MKKMLITAVIGVLCTYNAISQTFNTVTGTIYNANTAKIISGVTVKIVGTPYLTQSNFNGTFTFTNITDGTYTLQFLKEGYATQQIEFSVKNNTKVDIGSIYLNYQQTEQEASGTIILSDDDLLDDGERSSAYIAGLFQSSKDAYLKAAAYNFSQAWFKVRGYDAAEGAILINGIAMNKIDDGRPQWSNWGGLNDVFKNQDYAHAIQPSENAFGGILGTTNFSTRASEYNKGGKVSFASTNRSYTGRAMVTYASGLTQNNWAFAFSGSSRMAQEGYFEGTLYNAWSGFIAIEKKFNNHHSLNFTAFNGFNSRGKSSPNTQEVYKLKGYKYNSYWGNQNNKIRNSRNKTISEPVVMLSHYYTKNNTFIRTSFSYQKGYVANSRLGYFNAPNPNPTYWKYLPSYYLQYTNPDWEGAFLAQENFLNNGQINWNSLYQINTNSTSARYYLYDDRVDDTNFSANSTITTNLTDYLNLNAGISFSNLTSNRYAKMSDLLGSEKFIDLDQYAIGSAQQNNLNTLNNEIKENDPFQYSYGIHAQLASTFLQVQYTRKKLDAFFAVNFEKVSYQREGYFKNGTYPNDSFGKSAVQNFNNLNTKAGFTYKFSGRHLLAVNAASISNAPTLQKTYRNIRVNNNTVPNLKNEKIRTADITYNFRPQNFNFKVTGFYTDFKNAVETSFFFAEGLRGDEADFVSESVTGISKKHMGIELSATYQLTSSINLIAAGTIGQYTYTNNPVLYLESESFLNENSYFGQSNLKNYRVSGTPQRAYSLGFEYRDPEYWWFQLNGNYLSHNYIDIAPLLRTQNFYLDTDGLPFVDDQTGVEVTPEQLQPLLVQEKFNAVFLMNVVGGKSWKINNTYVGVFASINNALGAIFKSGGFEQSRNANYQQLKQDQQLKNPVFASKYWYGNQASYYLNLYYRF